MAKKIKQSFTYQEIEYVKVSEKNELILFADKYNTSCIITDTELNIIFQIEAHATCNGGHLEFLLYQ